MKKNVLLLCVSIFFLFGCGFKADEKKVYDEAERLTAEEENKLQQLCVETAKENKLDVIIMTVNSTQGKGVEKYAEDFYDNNGFGFDDEKTGILLLIDMESRKFWFCTTGKARDFFTDKRIDTMTSEVGDALKAGNYYNGFQEYINLVDKYMGENPNPVVRALKSIPMQIGISIVVGVIGILIINSGRKTAITVGSHTYLQNNQYNLRRKEDTFITTTTTVRKIETDNNSNNGSSGSNSGGSHGGGGGSF